MNEPSNLDEFSIKKISVVDITIPIRVIIQNERFNIVLLLRLLIFWGFEYGLEFEFVMISFIFLSFVEFWIFFDLDLNLNKLEVVFFKLTCNPNHFYHGMNMISKAN